MSFELVERSETAVATRRFVYFICGIALVGALLAAALGLGLGKLFPAAKVASQSCPSEEFAPAAAAEIKLTVYNSTTVNGLATKTSEQLKSSGVTVLKVADKAPPDAVNVRTLEKTKTGSEPQLIIATSLDAANAAATLQGFFPNSVVLLSKGSTAEVDLYLLTDKPVFQTDPGGKRILKCAIDK